MLLIGGFHKLSLIDYPGKVAAVVFTQGCNFRCPYCHNRELVIPQEFKTPIPEEEIFQFLKKRQDKLQGVVITGGEPTIQPDLIPFLRKIKQLNFAVKLDTNASCPDVIASLIQERLVDFFALDIKAPLGRYASLAGVEVNSEDLRRSIEIILRSGVEHMFRTTLVKPLFCPEDLEAIAKDISGARRFILQEFAARPTVLDPTLLDQGHYTETEFARMKEKWERR